jgi:hypothetical protein
MTMAPNTIQRQCNWGNARAYSNASPTKVATCTASCHAPNKLAEIDLPPNKKSAAVSARASSAAGQFVFTWVKAQRSKLSAGHDRALRISASIAG